MKMKISRTKSLRQFVTFILAVFLTTTLAYAKLNVVTSTPDLADIASRIGGDRITVTSIAKGCQDPHFVEPKPSYMLILNKADLYLVMGMSLEVGWSPSLEEGSRNPSIVAGAPGHVDCSQGIKPIEIPSGGVDRSMGDVHPYGNPHYQLDPDNGRIMAKNIAWALIRKDPSGKAFYEKNLADFNKRLIHSEIGWLKKMAPFKGLKVVTDHRMWSYFARRFGIDVIGAVEPKPGISPSPAHIAKLINLMKEQNVKVIIRTPYFDHRVPDMIAKSTGAKCIELPSSVGGISGINNYFELFDYLINKLTETAQGK
jgi:zinc/manganese transport system substrate-binding protein